MCYNNVMNSTPIINISDDSDFAELRQSGGIYVDKTAFLYRLLTWKLKKRFFVSRPRRFGKSLMISTLKYILQGQKELFKGTYIHNQTDYDWLVVPVIHLDFSSLDVTSQAMFDERIAVRMELCLRAAVPDYVYQENKSPASNFEQALCALYAGSGSAQIAVLVDEYDAPIGHALDRLEMAEYVRAKLEGIYSVVKTHVEKVSFLMLTGVSKFSQLSIFSGLNNVTDLYEDDSFATMFGYTDQELDDNFGDLMKAHAEKMHLPYKTYRSELKRWYNGYCFNRDAEKVYNPMAIAKTLSFMATEFRPTWTANCRPTMLVNYMKQAFHSGENFETGVMVYPEELGTVADLDGLELTDVLYQSGYLTIDRFDKGERKFVLRVPDVEISCDLSAMMLSLMSKGKPKTNGMRTAFIEGKVNLFLELLKPYYAGLVYGASENAVTEGNYQRALQAFFDVANIFNKPEVHQANGNRADLMAQYGDYVWVFELKRAKYASAEDALQQIIDRDYVAPYVRPGNTVYQIGLAFDEATHQLIDTKVQKLVIPVPED